MKVRMVRDARGDVDGVRLDVFQLGETYDLSRTVATLLICDGYAEPADSTFARRESTLRQRVAARAHHRPKRRKS